MRFKMHFEGEDSPERRFSGTIVGVEDISPQWEDSKWRSLKVRWDEPASIPRPERVSPWEIEPFVASVPPSLVQLPTMKHKRLRPHVEIPVSGETRTSAASASWNLSHELHQMNCVLEGQRSNNITNSHVKQADVGAGLAKHCSDSAINPCTNGGWRPSFHGNASQNMIAEETEECKSVSARSAISNYSAPSSVKPSDSLVSCQNEKKSATVTACRLFGIDLKSPSLVALPENSPLKSVDIPQDAVEVCIPSTVSSGSLGQKSSISKDSKELKKGLFQWHARDVQNRQSHSSRSRTKVQMQGVAVGRAVDLNMLRGYDGLVTELEDMFEIKGELRLRNKWEIVFMDDEGDTMLMGDDPWPEFCNMVRRIFICFGQDVKKMKGSKLPSLSTECEGSGFNLPSLGGD